MVLSDLLEKNDGTNKMVSDCLQTIKDAKKVLIFGSGVGGKALYELVAKNNLLDKLVAWSDNNVLKFNTTYCNKSLKVVPPQDISKIYGLDITIIVASSAYDIIRNQLISYGFSENNIYLYNFAFMDIEYTDKEFIWDHIVDFDRAYEKMNDEKSKRILVNILNYRITKDEKYLVSMSKDVDDEHFQYFDEKLYEKLNTDCFLDIGAYTGDTYKVLEEVYNGNFEKYYGLEADDKIFKELQLTINLTESKGKVELFNYAAWNKDETLFFDSVAGSTKMENGKDSESNKTAVKATTLDSLFPNKRISIIKMDIEGAEYNALSGMKNIIIKNKPILTFSVYHLRDDFYKLTDFIETLVPNEYKYYFRQYRYTPTETVCYAIPSNR